MRRQFELREDDEMFLCARRLSYETIIESNMRWLIIHEFPIPKGYSHCAALTAVLMVPGYPDTQLDMVYFFPSLSRQDGKAIGGLTSHPLDGKNWQRWSRHRTAQNPWRPGEDDLSTHLLLVDEWLLREFGRTV